ncbi:MAG: UDP-N-acetylmuramate--L-alanine ligase [Oscillospiraceae bacterium]|jgi:UDP-N-acetylmuramate--alanine ligase|nr:UDP-N-acetylmuramate--L-alanine ligase [Oscillospiraceae bacterium]
MSLLENHLKSGETAHLVGIGGVSMSPLAEVLRARGIRVTGSDMADSATVEHLRELGIHVTVGHSAENVIGAGYIIRTAAAREDNVEIAAADRLNIPVFERADAWGIIMRDYKNAVCVAGTHGKTTTTSMIAQIMLSAKADPTVMIGGTLPAIGAAHRVGNGDSIVLEACEYYNSFHRFFPTVAVITNVDADHLDFFENLDAIKASFRKFAGLVPESGFIIANGDDANTLDALKGMEHEVFTFGLGANCTARAERVKLDGKCSTFDVIYDDRLYCRVKLRIPGVHNVQNALAAASVAICLELPGEAVEDALASFTGAHRRFERMGKINGADVIDDYAHHPGELHALFDAIAQLGYKRVLVAFQPHTYTRTHALFDDFRRELSRADVTYLADIYAAREQNTIGISSADLAKAIPGAIYCPDFDRLTELLAQEAREGDVILTVGAGDINKVACQLTIDN